MGFITTRPALNQASSTMSREIETRGSAGNIPLNSSAKNPLKLCPIFWFVEGRVSGARPFVHRTLADCRPQLIFYYTGHMNRVRSSSEVESTFRSGVQGQTREFRKFTTDGDFGIFGIDLYPYTFPFLFSLPADELTNQAIDLRSLCGKEGDLLEEKVMSASNDTERIKAISEFLISRLSGSSTFSPNMLHSLKSLLNLPSPISMNQLSRDFYMSRRQFERRFKELCGFSPQACLRILRFNSSCPPHLRAPQGIRPSQAADASHFSKRNLLVATNSPSADSLASSR